MPEIGGLEFPEHVHREWPKWVNGVLCADETEAQAAMPPDATDAPAGEAVEPPAPEPAADDAPAAETPPAGA